MKIIGLSWYCSGHQYSLHAGAWGLNLRFDSFTKYLFLFLSGSPWADKTTLAILDFHESGKMEDLDNKWILLKKEEICDSKDDNSPATLGLNNMRGNN